MYNPNVGPIINLKHRWHLGDRIGEGGFAQVYRAWAEGLKPAVVKLIPQLPGAERELLFEHPEGIPNIVPTIESGEWNDHWVLVMPEADKSLRDYLDENGGRLTVDDAVATLIDIAEALVAIEEHVVHRDLKPENILLLNGRWCLADFGIAKYAEATTAANTMKGAKTPPYAAPEVWRDESATSATDVYAFGVIAYELLTGRWPFVGPDPSDFRRQHIEDLPESMSGIPLKLASLVEECLYKPSQTRPRPQNLLARLQTSGAEASPGALRLQAVNAQAVQRIAEEQRAQSVARAEAERRQQLYQVSDQSLTAILDTLHRQIEDNAHTVRFRDDPVGKTWRLESGGLEVNHNRMVPGQIDGIPFDVIAFTQILVFQPGSSDGFVGRSHSLWFCDAQTQGEFRWYESAFFDVRLWHNNGFQPFGLDPSSPLVGFALGGRVSETRVARPFLAIDQGAEEDFIERWIDWFARAAHGGVRFPRSMPEDDPHGSWRRSR